MKYWIPLLVAAIVGCAKKGQQQAQQPEAPPQPGINAAGEIANLNARNKGWRLLHLEYIRPLPPDVQSVAQPYMDDMLDFHRLWMKLGGDFQQEKPHLTQPGAMQRFKGRWRFDEAQNLIILTDPEGVAEDTLFIKKFVADTLIVETGPDAMRERRVYVPMP